MNIAVHVAAADLQGMDFERYASVLESLIGERFAIELAVDAIDISPGEHTQVLFDGLPSTSAAAAEILAMAREITGPAVPRSNHCPKIG